MLKLKLSKMLESLSSYPFHMPGHKRNSDFNISSSDIDITEIDGFDNLHNPCAVLKDIENEISHLYKSKKSIISVNGSTACILSAISAVCSKGDTILVARNCHKSVYNACLINELKVVYIEPEFDKELGVFTTVTQERVNALINQYPDVKAVVITSPTYEGIVSRIKASVPVIIDSAHGAHFGFANYLPDRVEGDIVINSLHKTLPCLTQCAAVHIYNEKYASSVKKYMDIFETSSPSYVLMSSIDRCVDFLNESEFAFIEYKKILDDFYNKMNLLDNIHILQNDDITRIILSVDGYTGDEISSHLRKNGIEPEGIGLGYVILISTVCDTEYGFDLLYSALLSLEKREPQPIELIKPDIPKKALEQFEVTDTQPTPLDLSSGMICGESIFAYPPDIPIITIGEQIDKAIIDYIRLLLKCGVNVLSDSNLLPKFILTKSE